ncbi:DNA-binding transcriptional regulator, LysR family [Polaromonas sp. OV174]|uniref:LysR substrate-binding domain-containing protein n=1 Tax=Polaromonas sp. OV174 TaxID=1855300 RepID=UPI0008F28BAD|nr:LysR substrate-binding domain-containing protein [Polaromonas sp. OV174]SFB98298.1 DNA-binding transcriptional regulator, LysR family [Polaromonas sp. OV174]
MRYSLVDIKLFVAVADAGNVSRGAATCFLAPSSASLRIKQLEETLGTQLFKREARGVSLTRAGQVMLEHCRRCLAELEQMHANLAPYADGVKTQVTLFANSTAIASFLPGDLQVFLRAYPDVRVSLEERLSHDIVSAVAEGRADLGVVTWDDEHPQLNFHPYREDELVVVTPMASSVGKNGTTSFTSCLSQPFISLNSGTAIHTFLVGKAASMGHQLDVRIQVAGFSAVVALVQSGAGIAIVPRSVLSNLKCDNVNVLTLCEPWARRQLRICARRESEKLSGHAKALLRLLCDGTPSLIEAAATA